MTVGLFRLVFCKKLVVVRDGTHILGNTPGGSASRSIYLAFIFYSEASTIVSSLVSVSSRNIRAIIERPSPHLRQGDKSTYWTHTRAANVHASTLASPPSSS